MSDQFVNRLPRVTAAWTCPWFEAIFALCFASIGLGILSVSTLGTIVAVVVALGIGALMGKRRLNRNLHGDSC